MVNELIIYYETEQLIEHVASQEHIEAVKSSQFDVQRCLLTPAIASSINLLQNKSPIKLDGNALTFADLSVNDAHEVDYIINDWTEELTNRHNEIVQTYADAFTAFEKEYIHRMRIHDTSKYYVVPPTELLKPVDELIASLKPKTSMISDHTEEELDELIGKHMPIIAKLNVDIANALLINRLNEMPE